MPVVYVRDAIGIRLSVRSVRRLKSVLAASLVRLLAIYVIPRIVLMKEAGQVFYNPNRRRVVLPEE